jgi:hypothetical protein
MNSKGLFKKRLMLIALMSVFIVPLLLAGTLYANLNWRPAGTTNSGSIIAQPLSDDSRLMFSEKGRWTLLMPFPSECDLTCEADLFKLRQVREALGKYTERLDYAVLVSEGLGCPLSPGLIERHTQMSVLANQALWNELTETGLSTRGDVLLIDPLGNLVMSYKSGFVAKGLYKDLKRVLKLSNIG